MVIRLLRPEIQLLQQETQLFQLRKCPLLKPECLSLRADLWRRE